jgi:hypothetical protein
LVLLVMNRGAMAPRASVPPASKARTSKRLSQRLAVFEALMEKTEGG